MAGWTAQIPTFVSGLLTGGVGGSLLTEWFRHRRSRTRSVQLLERVKRTTQTDIARGTRLYRVSSDDSVPPVPVEQLLQYEFTLFNTTGRDLQNCEILFEFASPDTVGWAERPKRSNTHLDTVTAEPTPPWTVAIRWRIPQFPPRDSVEFSFQSIEPTNDEYTVSLYNAQNVVVARTREEPRSAAPGILTIALVIVAAASLGNFLGVGWFRLGEWFARPADNSQLTTSEPSRTLTTSTTEPSPQIPSVEQRSAEKIVAVTKSWEEQKFRSICGNAPSSLDLRQLWADEYAIKAQENLEVARKMLDSAGLACSSMAALTKNEPFKPDIKADYGQIRSFPEWMIDLRSKRTGRPVRADPFMTVSVDLTLKRTGDQWRIIDERTSLRNDLKDLLEKH